MTPLEDVLATVLASCTVRPGVETDVADAVGLVLASDVVATEDVPPFANSAVDGYAVRVADVSEVPVVLRVVDEVAAGRAANRAVGPGEAVRIMTGAPVPEGCEAVVMVEDTERVGDDGVRVRRVVSHGNGIRGAASDVHTGSTVLRAGAVVTPVVVGVLATLNVRTVRAHRRPRVAVLSTGDELVDDGSPLAPGQIRESNRPMLVRLVAEAGCEPVDLGIVADDESVLEDVLRRTIGSGDVDAVVTSGGVSMGDYDVVKAVLPRVADMEWFQIAMKPAKPFAFGTAPGPTGVVPVFGLPGNPVSSLVSFEVVARPALRTMLGLGVRAHRPVVRAVLDEAVDRSPDGKVHFDRGSARWAADGRVHVRRAAAQASHQLSASASANCLVRIPDGPGLPAGSEVAVTFLGPDAGPDGEE